MAARYQDERYRSEDISTPYVADSALTERQAVVFGSTERHVDVPSYRGQHCAGLVFSEGESGYSSGNTRVAVIQKGLLSYVAGDAHTVGTKLAIYASTGRLGTWLPGMHCVGIAVRTVSSAGNYGLALFDVSMQATNSVYVIPTGNMTADTEITTKAPAGSYKVEIIYEETAGAAVTGGLDVGTTSSGEEVMSQQTCAASTKYDAFYSGTITTVAPYFTLTANDSLYFSAHTAWNSATVKACVILTPVLFA